MGWERGNDTDPQGRRSFQNVKAECETVERILAFYAEGLSLRAIARQLAIEGHRTKRGGKWASETVRKVIGRATR